MRQAAVRGWVCVLLGLGLAAGCGESTVTTQGAYMAGGDGVGQPGGAQDEYPGQAQSALIALSSPEEGAIVKAPKVKVEGRAESFAEVQINGAAVPVVDGAFSHELTPTQEGALIIEVSAGGERSTRRALVDWTEPRIVLQSPPRGAILVKGQQDKIEVRGQVVDSTGVGAVTVNGQPVTPDAAGNFSASLTPALGLNAVEVKAVDLADRDATAIHGVLYGEFNPWGQVVEDALAVRVSDQGLGLLSKALSENLGPELLAGLGANQPPGGDFQLRGLDIDGIGVELVPQDGWLEVTLRIYGLEIAFDALFNGSNVSGEIESNPAEIKLNVLLDADGTGAVDIAFSDPEIELHDFDFDVRGILGLVDWIIKGTVEREIEKAIVTFLTGFSLQDALTAESLTQTTELLGRQADIKLLVTGLDVDPQGLTATLDAGFDMAPAGVGASAPGSWKTPGAAPDPTLPVEAALRVGLADDFVNQLLGAIWRGGALELDLGALLAGLLACGDGALPFDLKAQTLATLMGARELLQHADGDTPVGLWLRAGLPPVLRLQKGEGKLMVIELGEAVFDFTLEKDGASIPWASISMQLWVDVGIGEQDGAPKLNLAIRAAADLIAEPLFDLKDEGAENALATLLTTIPALLGGDNACPQEGAAPFKPGVALGGVRAVVEGSSSDFLSLLIDLGVKLTPPQAPTLDILHTEVNPDNGHTYHLLAVSSWSDAEAFAVAQGGHLATVRNRDENEWIMDTFGRFDGQTRDLWIGLHDVGGEGTFTWTSGEPFDFERWANRSPDNGQRDDDSTFREHFVHIYGDRSPRDDGRWNDYKNEPYAPWNQGFHGLVEIITP